MTIADALVQNKHQAISYHHANLMIFLWLRMNLLRNMYIVLQQLKLFEKSQEVVNPSISWSSVG